ncbi:MAG: hypothetical protein ACO1Q7_15205 [Gemmatimonas sp.]
MDKILRNILWIDSIAALVAGFLVLGLLGWLSVFYNLPATLISAMGVTNLLYGTYSFILARRKDRARVLVSALAIANASWAVMCALIALRYASTASTLGLVHVVGEGCFVATLAAIEWNQRDRISGNAPR